MLWAGRRDKRRPIFLATALMLVAYAVALAALGHDAWVGAISTAVLLVVRAGADADRGPRDARRHADDGQPPGRAAARPRRPRPAGCPRPRLRQLEVPRADGGAPSPGRPPSACATCASPTPGARVRPSTRLDLEIAPGSSVAVVGANGAGKSTLIKLLCGLHRPELGHRAVDGGDPGVDDDLRRRVAVIFQEFVQLPPPAARQRRAGAARRPPRGRDGRRGGRPGPARRGRRPGAAPGRRRGTGCCRASTPAAPTSPAASGSGWPWPGRWPPSTPAPACSSSTSRPPRSTSAPRRSCSTTSWRSPAG